MRGFLGDATWRRVRHRLMVCQLEPDHMRPGGLRGQRCTGVTPTSLPSMKTRAPRGRESTKIAPVAPPAASMELTAAGGLAVRASGPGTLDRLAAGAA